jgi:hypothetical protein
MPATTRPSALSHETRMQDYPYMPVQAITQQDLNAALLALPFKIILMRLRSTAIRKLETDYAIQLKSAEEFDDAFNTQFRKYDQAVQAELQRFAAPCNKHRAIVSAW